MCIKRSHHVLHEASDKERFQSPSSTNRFDSERMVGRSGNFFSRSFGGGEPCFLAATSSHGHAWISFETKGDASQAKCLDPCDRNLFLSF